MNLNQICLVPAFAAPVVGGMRRLNSILIVAITIGASLGNGTCDGQDDAAPRPMPSGVVEDVPPLPDNDTPVKIDAVAPVSPDNRKKASEERAKIRTAGLAAIAGIAILGVGSIAITMVWARRLRRLARDPGPPQTTEGNDFWFLKPRKPDFSAKQLSETQRPYHSPESSESSEAQE